MIRIHTRLEGEGLPHPCPHGVMGDHSVLLDVRDKVPPPVRMLTIVQQIATYARMEAVDRISKTLVHS